MKPNKNLSKKTLTISEKSSLYSAIVSPYKKKMEEYDESLEKFVIELIEKYIMPEGSDLRYLSGKHYINCYNGCVLVCGSSFGLDDEYNPNKDTPGIIPVNILLSVYLPFNYPFSRNDRTIGSDIKKYVPSELIDILKDRLVEYSEIVYEYNNFGVGKIFHEKGRRKPFDKIKTWGQLYKLSEEWYDLAYEIMSDKLSDEYKITTIPSSDSTKSLGVELQLQEISRSLELEE